MSGTARARRAESVGVIAPPPDAARMLGARAANAARLLQEDVTALTPIMPWDRFIDGDNLLLPFGGGGYFGGAGWGNAFGWPVGRDQKQGEKPAGLLTEQEWRLCLAWGRSVCERNEFAPGFLDHLTNFTIGQGMQVSFALREKNAAPADANRNGEPDADPLVTACHRVWDEWCEYADWGQGEEDRERESCKRAFRDGECNLEWFADQSNGLPDVRNIEPELIRTPPGESPDDEWGQGVHTDPDDAEKWDALWATEVGSGGSDGRIIHRERVTRLKMNVDRTVKRGVSDFFPVTHSVRLAGKLLRNMAEVASIQAAIAYVTQHAPTATSAQVTQMIEAGKDYTAFRPLVGGLGGGSDNTTRAVQFRDPGQHIHLSGGQQFLAGPVQTAAGVFIQVEQAILRAVGMRFGAPEYFSGDASNNNFASSLVAGGPFERATQARQKKFSAFVAAVARKLLYFAERSGRLPAGTCRAVKVVVTAPSVSIVDKLQETQRRKILFDSGVLDGITWMKQEGEDPQEILTNLQVWREKFGAPQTARAGNSEEPPVRVGESRAGLVRKAIVDKNGVTRHVLVRPDAADATPDRHTREVPDTDPAEPEGVTEKARAAVGRAAERVKALAADAVVLMHRLGVSYEDVLDTPDDFAKIGMNPLWGTGPKVYDPVAANLGVSTNTALLIASHAVAFALVKGKRLLSRSEAVSDADLRALAEKLAEIVRQTFAELGGDYAPDPAAVEAYLRKQIEG